VVRQTVSTDLCGREIVGTMHRHALQAELLRAHQPCVADHDHAFLIYDKRLPEPKGLDTRRNLLDSLIANLAGVLRVGYRLVDRPYFDLHEPLSSLSDPPPQNLRVFTRRPGAVSRAKMLGI